MGKSYKVEFGGSSLLGIKSVTLPQLKKSAKVGGDIDITFTEDVDEHERIMAINNHFQGWIALINNSGEDS